MGAALALEPVAADLPGAAMTVQGPPMSDPATATSASPSSSGEALSRAEALLSYRRVPEALAAFEDPALAAVYPDACAGGRWQCHMLLGDLGSAWTENDGLRRRGSPDPHRFWDGRPLEGKCVMLRCLHGLGDAVQFLRYAPRLARLAAHLIVEVPPPLYELAPCLVGPQEVVTWGYAAPRLTPVWDTQVEIMELPYLFRSDLANLPAHNAGLKLPPVARSAPASTACPPRIARIGIAWSGGSWNPSRSLPFPLLEPLLSLAPQLSLSTLQPSSANREWIAGTDRYALQPAGTSLDSLLGLASFIAGLDLVITVDTLVAHLAGALGRSVWILLQHEADWRWLLDRSDSPWYPSARLFRQPAPGDWVGLIDCVRQELLSWSAHFTQTESNHAHVG